MAFLPYTLARGINPCLTGLWPTTPIPVAPFDARHVRLSSGLLVKAVVFSRPATSPRSGGDRSLAKNTKVAASEFLQETGADASVSLCIKCLHTVFFHRTWHLLLVRIGQVNCVGAHNVGGAEFGGSFVDQNGESLFVVSRLHAQRHKVGHALTTIAQ